MDTDYLFRQRVDEDIRLYLELYRKRPGCVLLFPPVDNYKRFLIHSSIENIENLCSFSIGSGADRRTVISERENLSRNTGARAESPAKITNNKARPRDKRRPDRPVYVPRAALQSAENKNMSKRTGTSKATKKETPKATEGSSPLNGIVEQNDDEGDWDSMFADDGECLNPDMMKELTTAIENVRIVPATSVSTAVQEQENVQEDEYSHVIEVSKFPVEFKTQDLMMLFMQYKESGFEIKWVDDTHALVIFANAKIANEVVETKYPGVHLKRLSEASAESKGRAKRSGATMKPYKPRPETCAALARRLVTGALGVKSTTIFNKETLENERRILREAKEKKLLARKEQKDIWEDDAS